MTVLDFDKKTHTYKVDGRVVPSVTQVLKGVGMIDETWFTPEATQRGTDVHTVCELDDSGVLVDAKLRKRYPHLLGYLAAWRLFKKDTRCEILTIEERLWNPHLGYAGQLDRTIILNARGTLADIKSGAKAVWHALQTAAYDMLVPRQVPLDRLCVYLRANGTYTVQAHSDPGDLDGFTSAVNWYHYLYNHGALLG